MRHETGRRIHQARRNQDHTIDADKASDTAAWPANQTMAEVMARLIEGMGFIDACEVNDCGYSWIFSDKLAAALSALGLTVTIMDSDLINPALPAHEWVAHANRHYDSETPDGVTDPLDLPYFQRGGRPTSY
jgi:hypothetical protein